MKFVYASLLAFFSAASAFATGGMTCTTSSGVSLSIPQGHVVGSPIPTGSIVTLSNPTGTLNLAVPEERVVHYWVEDSFVWLRGIDASATETVLLVRINGIHQRRDGQMVGYMALTAKLPTGQTVRIGSLAFPKRVVCESG